MTTDEGVQVTADPQVFEKAQHVVLIMWMKSIALSLFLFYIFSMYLFIQKGAYGLLQLSQAFAATSAIMIASSFALSGMCYYFNFLDKYIAYRKYIGLVGYFVALTYSFLLLFVDPARYYYGFAENFLTADVLLGLSAMTILTVMAIISNKKAMPLLGAENWKRILSMGYVAIFLLVVRAVVLEHESWLMWLDAPYSLPPARLLVSIYAVSVILLRLSVEVAKRRDKEVLKASAPTSN